MVPIGFMGTHSVNEKTRGYTALNVCIAFLFIFGALYLLSGVIAFTNGFSSGDPRRADEALLVSGIAFLCGLLSFTCGFLIQLMIHAANDLYMMRLLAVNEYRHRHPSPPAKS